MGRLSAVSTRRGCDCLRCSAPPCLVSLGGGGSGRAAMAAASLPPACPPARLPALLPTAHQGRRRRQARGSACLLRCQSARCSCAPAGVQSNCQCCIGRSLQTGGRGQRSRQARRLAGGPSGRGPRRHAAGRAAPPGGLTWLRPSRQSGAHPPTVSHHVVQAQVQLVQGEVLLCLAGGLASGVLKGGPGMEGTGPVGICGSSSARSGGGNTFATATKATAAAGTTAAIRSSSSRRRRVRPPGLPPHSPARWQQRWGCQSPRPGLSERSTAWSPAQRRRDADNHATTCLFTHHPGGRSLAARGVGTAAASAAAGLALGDLMQQLPSTRPSLAHPSCPTPSAPPHLVCLQRGGDGEARLVVSVQHINKLGLFDSGDHAGAALGVNSHVLARDDAPAQQRERRQQQQTGG